MWISKCQRVLNIYTEAAVVVVDDSIKTRHLTTDEIMNEV